MGTTHWNTRLGVEEEPSSTLPSSPTNSEPTVQEASLETDQVEALAKQELDFLAAIAMPAIFKYLFPPTFKEIWLLLTTLVFKIRDFSQLAIGLPRGFGKTMLVKLFILYVILFTKKKFILIICGTQTKANNIISDIVGMLNEGNIKKVFGFWQTGGVHSDRQDLKRFNFRGRTIILMGAGTGSDIRGITLENVRPDIMIFDDIQTREDADSEIVSANIETWMYGTAMKAKSPEGCLFLFIGNMYPTKHSILRKIKHNPVWIKFIAGGILANGESLWEELQPIAQLLREFENDLSAGRPEIFYSEVLNDEFASINRAIDVSKIPYNKYENEEQHQGNFVIIDPSNDKHNSDLVGIGYFEIYDEIPVLVECIEEKLSPGDCIEKALIMCLKRNCRLIAVESNAYQYSLLYWFNYVCTQKGIIGINCVDIYSGSVSKNSRILTMFKSLLASEVLIANAARLAVISQITSFNPLKTTNTDQLLDVLTYPHKVIELYGEFIYGALTIEMQESNAMEVHSEDITSPF